MKMNLSSFLINSSTASLNSTINSTIKEEGGSLKAATENIVARNIPDGLRYTYLTLMLIILVMIVMGNATLIVVICLYKKLHTTTNVFITNLAVGDLLLATAVIPFDFDKLLRGYFAFNAQVCEFSNTAFFLSLLASAVNLSIMTFERFCAIRFPLQHRAGQIFTKKRNIAILVCSWLYITITASLPVMGWRSNRTMIVMGKCLFFFELEYAVFLLVVNFIFPLLFIVVMNIWILYIARKGLETRLIARKNSRPDDRMILRKNSGCDQHLMKSRPGKSFRFVTLRRQSSTTVNEANSKATKIIAMLVGVFAACWLPYIINIAVNIICRGCSPPALTIATMLMVFTNSAINPILYGMYKPQILAALKEMSAKVCNVFSRNKRQTVLDKEIEITCV